MMAWAAVGLVVVVIVVLVIVKAAGGSSTDTAYTPVTPAPASVVHDVTNIPAVGLQQGGRHLVRRCR